MSRIVNLNELVPEDITIQYRDKEYLLPGDVSVETVFKLFELFQALTTVESKNPAEIMAQLRSRFGDIEAELLALFQQRDPKMTELPFGIASMGAVLKVVLGQLGLTVTAENPTPPPAKRKTAPRKRPTVK